MAREDERKRTKDETRTEPSDEEEFGLEAGLVGQRGREGATTTGDEREIGRAGEGGLEGATGKDSTLGQENEQPPVTGGATPEEAIEHGRAARRARDEDRKSLGRPEEGTPRPR